MRQGPKMNPANVAQRLRPGHVVVEARYRFLTYVMGGGVDVDLHQKPYDPRTPIRAASIRGQLRFWWRACNPSGCDSIAALQRREAEIWGSTRTPSAVSVVVTQQAGVPREIRVFEYNDKRKLVPVKGMKDISYGAFPLQPSQQAQKQHAVPGVLFDYGDHEFHLHISCAESARTDVEAALWAWETFGGLGGRTRRGFGAIERVDQDRATAANIERRFAEHRGAPRIDGIPSLANAALAFSGARFKDPIEAWTRGLHALQQLRQGAGLGRNARAAGSKSPAGRSRWPEADTIRRLTKKRSPKHRNAMVHVDAFPRAAFGMPILFHFHPGSRDDPESRGDPDMKQLMVQPRDADRLASPLVLRPVPDGEHHRAMALVFKAPLPPAILIAGEDRRDVRTRLDASDARQIQPLTIDKHTFTDPIERFLHELRRRC